MYAVQIFKFKCGEVNDVFHIVFDTKKQAKNFSKKITYPLVKDTILKVDLEWCNKYKPDFYKIKHREYTGLVLWEQR